MESLAIQPFHHSINSRQMIFQRRVKCWDSIKTRISQPPDTGTPTLLQRPVDRPTLFLRLYPRDGADGVAISGILCRLDWSPFVEEITQQLPVESPFLSAERRRSVEQFSQPTRMLRRKT
ncbi:hypothetical protein OUZ56_023328 [Daphnia magna]|uniref:Uncharacterized protein n=1 Tax=Daphnia magna TaxID=35525 RepID=A0ABR0AYX9_9CRUS|nr:hypothetical protein OUZ56_023328 [Daphnia magna]